MHPHIITYGECFTVDMQQFCEYRSLFLRRTLSHPADPIRLNFDSSENMTREHSDWPQFSLFFAQFKRAFFILWLSSGFLAGVLAILETMLNSSGRTFFKKSLLDFKCNFYSISEAIPEACFHNNTVLPFIGAFFSARSFRRFQFFRLPIFFQKASH